MPYLLDANVFIQARNNHYGFEVCPGFWDWLEAANADGRVFSIEKVRDELIDDELASWAGGRGPGFFLPLDPSMLDSVRRVAAWAQAQRYEPAAVTTFLQAADSYLVAQALALGCTIVTHEIPSASLRKVKIPDACIGLGVRFVTPFAMLRNERARFVFAGVEEPGGSEPPTGIDPVPEEPAA